MSFYHLQKHKVVHVKPGLQDLHQPEHSCNSKQDTDMVTNCVQFKTHNPSAVSLIHSKSSALHVPIHDHLDMQFVRCVQAVQIWRANFFFFQIRLCFAYKQLVPGFIDIKCRRRSVIHNYNKCFYQLHISLTDQYRFLSQSSKHIR